MGGEWGRAVINGVPQYLSATGLTTADPNSYGGCPRRWAYKYVLQKPEPQTAAMRRGTKELHQPIEHYYLTGQRSFPRLVLAIQHYLPERGKVLVEQQIGGITGNVEDCEVTAETQSRATATLAKSALRAAGVPIIGKVDLLQASGSYIDNQGELRKEADPRTIEVIDWKSTGAWEYAKSATDLHKNIQMDTYDGFGRLVAPRAEFVRRSHVYSLTKGAAEGRKSTTLCDREHSARRWEYVEGVARLTKHIARETDIEKVDAQSKSCGAYRGCPHASYCSVGKHNSLSSTFDVGAILKPAAHPRSLGVLNDLPQIEDEETLMSLLKVTGTTPTVTTLPASQGVGVAIAPATGALNMIEQLEAEERAAINARSQGSALDPRARQAFDVLKAAGMGEPMYKGPIAAAKHDYLGTKYDDNPVTGHGRLAGLEPCDSIERLVAIGVDMQKFLDKRAVAQPAPVVEVPAPAPIVLRNEQPIAILPDEVPASNPALASLPVEGYSTPTLPITTATLISASDDKVEPGAKKTRGPRKAKPEQVKTTTATVDGVVREVEQDVPFVLYYDCMPSTQFESMQPLVDQWCAAIANYYKADPPDMRCSKKDPLGFGGWKGVLGCLVREEVIKPDFARGPMFLRSSEINDVVAEAMAGTVDGNGHRVLDDLVRGLR